MFSLEVTDISGGRDLEAKLKSDILAGIPLVRREVEVILRQSIMENIYSGRVGSTVFYSATQQLADAFTATSSGLNIHIFMDPGKVNYPSWFGGGDFGEGLMQSFESGGGPGFHTWTGKPVWHIPATGYFEKAFTKMEVELVNVMRSHLQACGWDVS